MALLSVAGAHNKASSAQTLGVYTYMCVYAFYPVIMLLFGGGFLLQDVAVNHRSLGVSEH